MEDPNFCPLPLRKQLSINLDTIQALHGDSYDYVQHSFQVMGDIEATIIFLDSITDQQALNEFVLEPLTICQKMKGQATDVERSVQDIVQQIQLATTQEVTTISQAIGSIHDGNPVMLLEHHTVGLSFGLAKHKERKIEEPLAESVIRGPREGFTEIMKTNIALLRKRIKTPELKLKPIRIGAYSDTQVVVAYINGMAKEKWVQEIIHRLENIQAKALNDSNSITERIQSNDSKFSLFPQLLETERPDSLAAYLYEGRVGILVENTPVQLIAPTTFFSLLHSPEDYYLNWIFSTLMRLLRFLAVLISLLVPATYIAVISFHQQMIPTSLMITIASSRELVPFPSIIEVLIMEIMFELLREAGIRLPKQFGSAVGIVGALILGEAAVQAGIISAPMIIVVAITGIANFTLPHYSFSIAFRVFRFVMIFLSGMMGMIGLIYGVIFLVVHLCTLRSFGVPYLAPLSNHKWHKMKDMLLRAPDIKVTDHKPQRK